MKPALRALALYFAIASVLLIPILSGRAAIVPDAALDVDPLYRQSSDAMPPAFGDLTPTMLDVLAQAAAAADQPYSWAADHIVHAIDHLRAQECVTPGRR